MSAASHDDDGDTGSATITHAVVDAESDEDYDAVHRTWRWQWLCRMMMLPAIVVTAAENFGVTEGCNCHLHGQVGDEAG